MVGSGLGRDFGLSTLTLALSLPGRGNKTASPLRAKGDLQRSQEGVKIGGLTEEVGCCV